MVKLELEKYFDDKKQIFKDAVIFDNSYYPKNPIGRKEAEIILEKVADFMRLGISEHLFIAGRHGSGKTLYGKYLVNEIQRVAKLKNKLVSVEYRNCRDYSGAITILKSLCSEEQTNTGDIRFIKETFFKELNRDLILILDEVDELEDADYLLYLLSRISEIQDKTKRKVQLILISNKSEWDRELDNAVRSSLNLTKIIFREYSKKQIRDILNQRIKLGLINNTFLSEKILNTIIEKTIEHNSDLRIALKSLFLVCKEIEKKGIASLDEDRLEKIYEEAMKEIQLERIARLDNTKFFILYSVGISQSDAVQDIFRDAYKKMCMENSLKELGYTRFNFYLKFLNDQDLILTSKGKKGKTLYNKAKLNVNRLVMKEEYDKRRILSTKYNAQ